MVGWSDPDTELWHNKALEECRKLRQHMTPAVYNRWVGVEAQTMPRSTWREWYWRASLANAQAEARYRELYAEEDEPAQVSDEIPYEFEGQA